VICSWAVQVDYSQLAALRVPHSQTGTLTEINRAPTAPIPYRTDYPTPMKPTRLISPPGTYFVTATTFQRRRFFVVETYARLFLKTRYHYRRHQRFLLHEFVVMPDHVHLLITPALDVTIERALQFIEGGYSHAVGQQISRREIWQRGFTDHRIRDADDFAGHRIYIHQNPVMAKLAISPAEYRYSSAYPGFKLDKWPPAAEAAFTRDLKSARL
jgi:putative transposase